MGILHRVMHLGLHFLDWFVSALYKKPQIEDKYTTIRKITEDRCSAARFGDGELGLIFGRPIGFQKYDPILADRLKEVLRSNNSDKFIVCISRSIYNSKLDFYKKYRVKNLRKFSKIISVNDLYYCADISRFYKNYGTDDYIEKLKSIWDKRELMIVEGDKSRMGVGNDLFDNAKTIKRILCPAKNAFDYYESIYTSVINNTPKDYLILIALGPTATVLAYDLYRAGYQAVDIGHVDISYEWFLRGISGPSQRIPIPGKYVNEARGGDHVEACDDLTYISQIVVNIEKKI